MTGKNGLIGLFCLALLTTHAIAGAPTDRIRAAQTDLRVFCPAISEGDIQWPALLSLNQTTGAEIQIALFHPSPVFTLNSTSTADGQFHLAAIGLPESITEAALIDSLTVRLFPDRAPDLVICGARDAADSARITSLAMRMGMRSAADTSAFFKIRRLFF